MRTALHRSHQDHHLLRPRSSFRTLRTLPLLGVWAETQRRDAGKLHGEGRSKLTPGLPIGDEKSRSCSDAHGEGPRVGRGDGDSMRQLAPPGGLFVQGEAATGPARFPAPVFELGDEAHFGAGIQEVGTCSPGSAPERDVEERWAERGPGEQVEQTLGAQRRSGVAPAGQDHEDAEGGKSQRSVC